MAVAVDYQKFNPYRKPSWRFDRVLAMVDNGPFPKRCTRRDDDFVRRTRNFILRWRAKETDVERAELFAENPGLYYAYELYDRYPDDPTLTLYIEARLLAGQSDQVIADTIGTMPETIEWYEALFFNVRDRLRNRDWIAKHVLMPAIQRNPSQSPEELQMGTGSFFRDSTVARPFMDATLKFFAYFGGEFAVDVFITGFRTGKPVKSPEDLEQWFDEQWAMTIRRRAAQAALTFQVDKFNVTELFAVYTKLIEIARSEDSAETQRTTAERHIEALVKEIPWMVGEDGAQMMMGTTVGKYDEQAAGLRDVDLLRLSVGDAAAVAEEDMLLEMPPPRPRPSK